MLEDERPKLEREHAKRWAPILPASRIAQRIDVTVGPTAKVAGAEDPPQALAPTLYADYARSGVAAWWMEIGPGAVVTVGTSEYTRWRDVWGKASRLLQQVGEALGAGHPMGHVRSLELTYEDEFVPKAGSGASDCAPEQIIDTAWMPKQVGASQEWHAGQGWVVDPTGKRLLERFQVAGVVRQDQDGRKRPAITIQTTAVQGFGNQCEMLSLSESFKHLSAVHGDGLTGTGMSVGEALHASTSRLFKSLLCPTMAARIDLAGDAVP